MKRDRHEYYRGQKGKKYGIYNTAAKCFQFGICEDTPMLAEARLFQLIGDDARKWRFEPRALPPDGLRITHAFVDEPGEVGMARAAEAFLVDAGVQADPGTIKRASRIIAKMAMREEVER